MMVDMDRVQQQRLARELAAGACLGLWLVCPDGLLTGMGEDGVGGRVGSGDG
jgi:hypothetical protein